MKRFRFNKIKWDKILSAALVIVLLVGCVAGLAAIFTTKTIDVSDFEFKKGALDEYGYYEESDTSIYTKDLIECQGLVIEPDFEATGKYQVFYYSANKTFVGASDQFDAHLDGIYEKGNTFNFAKYCRIVISPDAPVDEDNRPVDKWKIHFWEVAGYADDYKITVNKNQNYSLSKALESCTNVASMFGEGRYNPETGEFLKESTGLYFTNVINTSDANSVIVKISTSTLNSLVDFNGEGIIFTVPVLYEAGNRIVSGGIRAPHTYEIVESNAEFTYISYNVSQFSSIVLAVDINSVDVLEVYAF